MMAFLLILSHTPEGVQDPSEVSQVSKAEAEGKWRVCKGGEGSFLEEEVVVETVVEDGGDVEALAEGAGRERADTVAAAALAADLVVL